MGFEAEARLWSVYIVECSDHSLYTGIAKDVVLRIHHHNTSTRGAKYTRARRPVHLVWQHADLTRQEAQKLEREIKAMGRPAKLMLILGLS